MQEEEEEEEEEEVSIELLNPWAAGVLRGARPGSVAGSFVLGWAEWIKRFDILQVNPAAVCRPAPTLAVHCRQLPARTLAYSCTAASC